MNFYLAHQDQIVFAVAVLIATAFYWTGNEVGYRKGLHDGFADGVIEGEKH